MATYDQAEQLDALLALMERHGPFRVVDRDERQVRIEIDGMVFAFSHRRAWAFLTGAEDALRKSLSLRRPYPASGVVSPGDGDVFTVPPGPPRSDAG